MKKIIDSILEFKKSHSEKKWYGEKKLYNMLVFFKGYSYGEKFEFIPNFDKYVREYFNLENNKYVWQDWVKIINFFSSNDEIAFEYFYEILEAYIKNNN